MLGARITLAIITRYGVLHTERVAAAIVAGVSTVSPAREAQSRTKRGGVEGGKQEPHRTWMAFCTRLLFKNSCFFFFLLLGRIALKPARTSWPGNVYVRFRKIDTNTGGYPFFSMVVSLNQGQVDVVQDVCSYSLNPP